MNTDFVIQKPQGVGMWLYRDENEIRIFSKEIARPQNTEPWAECTDAEKTEWEEAHKPIEPPQVEDTQADVVE